MKGQVSSEYMIILAIVLVIAIAAVLLLRGVITTGGSLTERQSRSYWNVASPFSILAQKYAGNVLELDIQSTLAEPADVTQIEIEGTGYTLQQTFTGGQRKIVNITLSTPCGQRGDAYSLDDVRITYEREGQGAQLQQGDVPLVGSCA